jgi:flagellar protein FlaJ
MVGIYLDEIVDKVKMGKTLEQAILEAVETCPSAHLRALYWQLLNSLQTGADITSALRVQLDDIVENQKILIEEYGRELNALSLFYMMLSIIIPTVGFTIVTAVLTFIGAPITLWMLIGIWAFLTVIQYFFLMITARRRPSVEAH